jgi:hypothetical protein
VGEDVARMRDDDQPRERECERTTRGTGEREDDHATEQNEEQESERTAMLECKRMTRGSTMREETIRKVFSRNFD